MSGEDAPAASLSSHASAVQGFLSRIPVNDYRSPRAVVQIPHTASVADALKILNDAGVSGAPVFEDTMAAVRGIGRGAAVRTRARWGGTRHQPRHLPLTVCVPVAAAQVATAGLYSHAVPIKTRSYIGFVDASDLSVLVATKGVSRPTPEGFLSKIGNLFSTDVEHLVERAINLSGHDKFYGVTSTGNMAQVAKVLSRGAHRVAIVDSRSDVDVLGIVTASTVLKLLSDNIGVLGNLADAPVGLLFPTGPDTVKTEPADATARHCLQVLVRHGYLGMPIVDATGAIVGNISTTDVLCLAGMSRAESDAALDQTAFGFLAFVAGGGADKAAIRSPLVVKPTDSLATALRLIVTAKVHRVYIVDSDSKPVGIVSATDVLALALSETLTPHECAYLSEAAAAAPVTTDGELTAFLRSVTSAAFVDRSGVKFEGIVDVASDATAATALEQLSKHHISSVAVYVEEALPMTGVFGYGGPGFVGAYVPLVEKKYIGWVDAAGTLW